MALEAHKYIDYRQIKYFALTQLRGRWLLPVCIQLITTVVAALFYYPLVSPIAVAATIDDAVTMMERPAPIAGMLIFAIVVRMFFVAEVEVYGAMTKSPEKVGFGTFIDGFADWARAAGVTLWKVLFLYLWALLCFFPAVIKFYSYYFAEYIVAEFPAVSPYRAIGISRRVTRGAKWQLFVLDLTLLPWVLLGMITSGVGMLWAMPYVRMVHINAFHALLKSAIEDGSVTLNELGAQINE